jgi:putative membrane protein
MASDIGGPHKPAYRIKVRAFSLPRYHQSKERNKTRSLLNWLLSAISLLVVAHLVPGFYVRSFTAALVAALVIGLVNATLGLLLKVITFPLAILTLGIFWWVINALMLLFASHFVRGFEVRGFWPAFWGAIVLSLLNMVLKGLKRDTKRA